MAAARLVRRLASVARSEARCLAPAKVGRAMAMRSPMIKTTTISSMRVKPASLLREDLIRSFVPPSVFLGANRGRVPSGPPPTRLCRFSSYRLPGTVARRLAERRVGVARGGCWCRGAERAGTGPGVNPVVGDVEARAFRCQPGSAPLLAVTCLDVGRAYAHRVVVGALRVRGRRGEGQRRLDPLQGHVVTGRVRESRDVGVEVRVTRLRRSDGVPEVRRSGLPLSPCSRAQERG